MSTHTATYVQLDQNLHCPEAGQGQGWPVFAGPDPGPKGWGQLSVALAWPGQGQGRPQPSIFRNTNYLPAKPSTNSYTLNFISNIGLSIDYKGILNKIHTEKQ